MAGEFDDLILQVMGKEQERMPQGWGGGPSFMERAIQDFRPSENVEDRRGMIGSMMSNLPPLYNSNPETPPPDPGFDEIITQVLEQMAQERKNTSQVLSPEPVEKWRGM